MQQQASSFGVAVIMNVTMQQQASSFGVAVTMNVRKETDG